MSARDHDYGIARAIAVIGVIIFLVGVIGAILTKQASPDPLPEGQIICEYKPTGTLRTCEIDGVVYILSLYGDIDQKEE